jgi:outer membrane protein assembly factor BamB
MGRIREILLCMIVCLILLITLVPLGTFSEESGGPSYNNGRKSRSTPGDQWPMLLGEASRTGNSTANGPDEYNLIWSVNVNMVVWSSPVVMYDQIYVPYNGGLRCYDMNGTAVWTFTRGTSYSTPLVYNGFVYYAAGNGALYCINANASGSSVTPTWTYAPSGVTSGRTSPVTDGEKIYYATYHTSGLHAVWLSNGSKAWNASLGGSTVTESSPAYWNGRVYCGGGFSYLPAGTVHDMFCFNATNGNLIWKFTANDDICGTPTVEYGRVYFGTINNKLYCVDAIGSGGTTTKYWEYTLGGVYASTAVAYGRVYIGDDSNVLRCLDALATGGTTTQYWSQTLTPTSLYGICSSVAVTPKYLYVGTCSNAIHCRNRTTGALEWSQTMTPIASYGISSSPAVYGDNIYVTSDNGYLYAIGPDIIPPKVVSSSPTNGANDVMLDGNISVKFNEDIDLSTMTSSNFILKDSQDNVVSGTLSSDMGIETVFFTPDSDFEKEETYNFTVKAGVTDLGGNSLDGNGNGIGEGLGIDYFGFNFTTIPFYAPKIDNIPTLKPTEDVSFNMDFTSYLSDQDTLKADLILTEDSLYGTLDGFKLTLLYPEGVLRDTINLTVSDGMLSDYQIITVWVKPVNDAPVLGTLAPLELTEDVSYILNVTSYITDVDSPLANLTVYDSTYSKYVKVQGMEFNFTYPEGVTEDLINITVYDSYEDELRDTQDLEITIEPVNDPPTIKQLPPVTVKEDGTFKYSVDEFISDVDTPKATLMVSVDSPYVAVKGHELTLTYPDSVSTDNLNVKVFDGEYYANESLFVFVDPVNDPPIIISIDSPNDGDEFEHDDTIDFTAQISDRDLIYGDDKLTFKWTSDIDGQLASTQNATGISLSSGKHEITFTVLDREKERDTESIDITVKEKQEEPEPDKNETPDPDPKPPVDKDDDKKESTSGNSNFGLIIAGVVVAVIIVILLSLLMIRKKKGKKPEALEPAAVTTVPPQDQQQLQPGVPIQPQQFPPGQFPQDQTLIDPSLMYGQFSMDPTMQDPTMMQSQFPDQGQYQDLSLQETQTLDQTQTPEFGLEPAPQFPEQQDTQPQLPPAEPQEGSMAEAEGWEASTDQQQTQPQENLQQPLDIESPDGTPVGDPLQSAPTFSYEDVSTKEAEQPGPSESPEPKKDSETE